LNFDPTVASAQVTITVTTMKSMVPCRDCQTEVSRSAKSCPKCGCRNPAASKLLIGIVAAIFFGPLILIALVIILAILTG
jgi:hypothetical protein